MVDWKVRAQWSAQHLPVILSFLYKGPENLQGLTLRQPPLRFGKTSRRMIQFELRKLSRDYDAFKGSVDKIYSKIEMCFISHGVAQVGQEKISSGPL